MLGNDNGSADDVMAASPANAPPFNSTWLRSFSSKVNLTVAPSAAGGQKLRWQSPEHFSAIFSYLPRPLALAKPGDKVKLAMRWRSSGDNECPPSCYAKGQYCQSASCQKSKCMSKSVNCLAGTGDFRIALLDTSHVAALATASSNGSSTGRGTAGWPADDWCPAGVGYGDMTKCVEGAPFSKMRGYDFRLFPHLTASAKHEPGQVPCSIYRKSSPNLFGKSPRLGEWGCFGTPVGEWTTLTLSIERKSSGEVKVGMEMNGVLREATDKIKPSDPTAIKQVDAIAIGYPNGRHYEYIELASV